MSDQTFPNLEGLAAHLCLEIDAFLDRYHFHLLTFGAQTTSPENKP
jgi:hypothetical protein